MQKKRVAVVGGGISGLSCAFELSKQGFEVQVFEGESTVGGRMNTRVKDGFSFDFGADFLADCYSSLNRLAEELGVDVPSVGLVRHVFLRGGELHNMNFSSIRDVLRFEGISLFSRLRLLAFAAWVRGRYPELDFFDLSTLPLSLESGNAYDFCTRFVGQEFADYIVDPFTSCMMFYRARDMSVGAFLALFSMMMSPCYSFGIRRAKGAMRAIPLALAARLDVLTSAPADLIARDGDRILVRSNGVIRAFDTVVLATPATASLAMLRDPSPAQLEVLEGTSYSQTIDVSFRIPESALRGVHCYYVPFVESPIVSEFTNEAIKADETVQGETTLVNVGLHEVAARQLFGMTDEEVFKRVKEELVRVSPQIAAVADSLRPHDLQRWTQAIPRYTGEQLARVQRFWSMGQGDGNVYLCGDYLNHPWIEGAVRCGQRVAALIFGEQRVATPRPRSVLPQMTRAAGPELAPEV